MFTSLYRYVLTGLLFTVIASLSGCVFDENADEKQNPEGVVYDCSSSETLAAAEKSLTPWQMASDSASGRIHIEFRCDSDPFVGDFQSCEIQLSQHGKATYADAISMEGGMKAHGHGLPTVPVLSPTAKKGHYRIDGLKYSMPGEWTVGFKVNMGGQWDTVIFDFNI